MEARTDDAAHRLGFHSLRAVTRVDCRVGANLVLAAETFDGVDLSGPGHPRSVSNAWVRPTAESYMSAVTERVCAAADGGPSATPATMRVTLGSAADPAPPAATAIAPSIAVTRAHAVAPAAGIAITPVSAVARAIAVTPASAPPAQASPQRLAAQVAAEGTAQDAQKVLDGLRALIAPPLTGSVQLALVQHAHFYRASVSGFASMAEARTFCARAAHVTSQCWVRREAAP